MVKRSIKKDKFFRGWKPAPLQSSFFVTSIIGVIISAYYVLPKNKSFGLAFVLVFVMMFISSFISMVKGPVLSKDF